MIERLLGGLLALLLLALCLITVAQVGLRYILGDSLVWAEEAGIILLILMAWLGVSLLWLTDGHVGIELLPDSLPPGPRRWLLAGLDLACSFAAGALAWAADGTVAVYWNLDLTALQLPAAVKYLPVQIGAGMLCAAALLRLWRRLA